MRGRERSLPTSAVKTRKQDQRDTDRPGRGQGKRKKEQGKQNALTVWHRRRNSEIGKRLERPPFQGGRRNHPLPRKPRAQSVVPPLTESKRATGGPQRIVA